MSLDAYTQVWKNSKVTEARDLLVLLAIADYARDDGTNAFAPNKRMAEKARLKSVRGLQLVYERLEEAGELLVEPGAGPVQFTKGGPQRLSLLHVVYQDGSNAAEIAFLRERRAAAKGGEPRFTASAKGVKASSPPSAKGVKASSPPVLNGTVNTKHDFGEDESSPQSPPARVAEGHVPEQPRLPGTGSTRRRGAKTSPGGGSGPGKGHGAKGHAPIPETYFRQMYSLCFLTTPETEVLLTKAQRGQVAGVLAALSTAGVDLGRLPEFTVWWASNWRSREKGSGQYVPPRPIQVQELWMTAMTDRDKMTYQARVEQNSAAVETLKEAMLRRAETYGAAKKQ
jgi:hypothetical protein